MKIFHVTSNVQLATVSVLGLKQAKKKICIIYYIHIHIYQHFRSLPVYMFFMSILYVR